MKVVRNAFLLTLSLFLCMGVVKAEGYYTNNNGVSLTEKEYNYVIDFYGDDYPSKMTAEDYNWIQKMDVNNRDYKIEKYYDNDTTTRSTHHQTSSKYLAISKACGSTCSVTILLKWLKNPNVRSYDVIGARFVNTSLISGSADTFVSSSAGSTYYSNYQYFSNGFGNTVKLPTNATSIMVQQNFEVQNSGTVYGSYQHATGYISLAQSKKYSIHYNGAGTVFLFDNSVNDYFDQMGGVYISM